MVNELSQYDMGIAFKLYNFVQVTFYHQCEQLYNSFIYLNQYVGNDILSVATLALARDQGKGVARLRAYK
jgi:hypothetical protein